MKEFRYSKKITVYAGRSFQELTQAGSAGTYRSSSYTPSAPHPSLEQAVHHTPHIFAHSLHRDQSGHAMALHPRKLVQLILLHSVNGTRLSAARSRLYMHTRCTRRSVSLSDCGSGSYAAQFMSPHREIPRIRDLEKLEKDKIIRLSADPNVNISMHDKSCTSGLA